jgi:hemoglobin/transferrin/lactoferrin receptor protein
MTLSKKIAISTVFPILIGNVLLIPIAMANDKKSNTTQETMIVTADRSEQSIWDSSVTVAAIDRDQLDQQNGDSIIEALRDIPGVDISDNGLAGRKQIMIRGESSSRILMLIDGQEVSYHRSGHNSGAGMLIDTESVERIEVIKGPYSVLYGSQAIGGVINFITRKGSTENTALNGHTKFIYNGATNGLTEMGSLYGSLDGIFDYRISGTYSEQKDRKTPKGRLPNTHFDNNSVSAWFGLNLDQQKLGLSLEHYKLQTQTYADQDQLDGLNSFVVKLPKLKRQKVGLFYDATIDRGMIHTLHIDGYYQKLARDFVNQINASDPDMDIQSTTNDQQKTTGINLQTDLQPYDRLRVIIGAQYLQDKVDQIANKQVAMYYPPMIDYTKYTYGNNDWKQQHLSLFTQGDLAINDYWNWNLGLRQYWVKSQLNSGQQKIFCNNRPALVPCRPSQSADRPRKDHEHTLVMSSGLTYEGITNTILRGSFAQGYVYPTLTHLYAITNAHTDTIYGNPDLEAEKSNNYELGLRYHNGDWLVDTAMYYMTAKNYITTQSCNGNQACYGNRGANNTFYINANRAKSFGLELSVEYLNGDFVPYLQGALLRRKIETASYQTYETGNPLLTGTVGIKHNVDFAQMDIDSNLFVRFASNTNKYSPQKTYHYGGFSTLNLTLSSHFGPQRAYQLDLELNNLTNKSYTTSHEAIPAAKFNAVLAVSMKF